MTTQYSHADVQEFENTYLIWLDATVNTSTENVATQKELRPIVHLFRTFSNAQDCEQYLKKKTDQERVFLIASGRLGQEIVPRIHQLRSIFAIYIYCQEKERNEEWSRKFTKVRIVATQLEPLISKIKMDYSKRVQYKIDDPFTIDICQTNHLSDALVDESFFSSQLLMDYIVQMTTIPTDKTNFVNFCLNQYGGNSIELARIQEFKEKYQPDQAMWWYTRDSFVYRLLTKALSTRNYELLIKMGFFIRDMYETLKKYQLQSSVQVYHGQILSIDELQLLKNSIGQFVSVNTFLSTDYDSRNIDVCLNDFPIVNNLVRVVFEISADLQPNSLKPFANITSLTYCPQQQQVFFASGSVFQLVDVQQNKKSGHWIVKMILTYVEKEYDYTSLLSCGHLLLKTKRYDECQYFFMRLLKEKPYDTEFVFHCYYALGLLEFCRKRSDTSIEWYQKAIEVCKTDDVKLAECYYSIGCAYQSMYNYQQALQSYGQAIDIWEKVYGDDAPHQMGECLNNMGCIYEIERFYTKALACHKKALDIRDKYELDQGSSYNNIGNIYLCLGEYGAAIESYEYAIRAKSKLLLKDPSLGTTLRNMGLAFEEDTNYTEALSCYKRAALVFEQILPPTHTYISEMQNDIKRIQSLMKSNSEQR